MQWNFYLMHLKITMNIIKRVFRLVRVHQTDINFLFIGSVIIVKISCNRNQVRERLDHPSTNLV